MAQSRCATKLEEMVQCAICFEPLDQPLTFKCFHSFCSKCTSGFRTETVNGREAYACPECRHVTYTDELQRTHLLTNLLELRQLFIDDQKPCSKCEKNKPTWRCLQCKSNCCDTCKKDHDFYPMLKDHHLVLLSDTENSLNVDKVIYCETHKDKMLELHCQPCDALICYLCKAVEHDGHTCKTIDQSLQEILPTIEKQRDAIMSRHAAESRTLSQLNDEILVDSNRHVKLEAAIQKRTVELETQLNQEHARLMEQIAATRLKRKAELEEKKEMVQSSINEMQGILTWTKNLFSTTQGVSLLTELRENVKRQLETVAAKKETIVSETIGPFNITFQPSDTMQLNLTGIITRSELTEETKTTSNSTTASKCTANVNGESQCKSSESLRAHKTSTVHNFAFYKQDHCNVDFDQNIEPANLPFRSSCFTINGETLFVSETRSNKVHTYDKHLHNVTESHRIVQISGAKPIRGLVVVGQTLVIASNKGLILTNMDGSQTEQVTTDVTLAVADYKSTVCALTPGKQLAVKYFSLYQNKIHPEATYTLDGHDDSYANSEKDFKEGCFSMQLTKHHIWVSSWRMRVVEQYDRFGGLIGTIKGNPTFHFPAVCDKDKDGNVLVIDRNHGLFMITKTGGCYLFGRNQLTEVGMCFAKCIHQSKIYVLSDSAKHIQELYNMRARGTMKVFKLTQSVNTQTYDQP